MLRNTREENTTTPKRDEKMSKTHYAADWKHGGPVEARATIFIDGTFGPLESKEHQAIPSKSESDILGLQDGVYGWYCPLIKANKPYRKKGGMEQFAGKVAESRGHDHADRMYTPFIRFSPMEQKGKSSWPDEEVKKGAEGKKPGRVYDRIRGFFDDIELVY